MVPSHLKVLAKFGLCSNCSQKNNWMSARLLVLAKFLQVLACSDLPCSVSIICILKTKTDTGNNVSRMGNRETLTRAMNVSGKMLPRFVDVYWN